MELFDKVKALTEIQATSGFEGSVRDYLKTRMIALGYQPEFDGLGGIFVTKTSKVANAPRIMIAAHMDEVGFMVSSIKADGTFRVVPLGGWNPLVVSGQRFTLFTRTGKKIPVVTGGLPPHLLRGTGVTPQIPAISDIVFDGAFENAAEAAEFGIAQGDVIIPETETILSANGKNIISKAWDNRYGVLMVSELVQALAGQKLDNELYVGANVQEEVGLRGAHVSTTKFDPEVFLAVDCSPAGDIYGDQGAIGEGTLIRFFDPGHLMLPNMKDFLLTTAEEAGIKYQYYCGKGGTDAGAAHLKNGGVPSTTIGVCARYIHSHQTLYAMDDFLQAQAFLQALVKKLDRSTVDLIKNY